MPSKRYILYLEPTEANPLLQRTRDFFQLSSNTIGVNEAQQYRPHCSITGFFQVDLNPQGEVDPINTLCHIIDNDLERLQFSISITGVEMDHPDKQGSNELAPSVRISLKTKGFQEISANLKEKMINYDVHIRPKLVNHISLAYINNYPLVSTKDGVYQFFSSNANPKSEIVNYDPTVYFTAAQAHFDGCLIDSNEWNLVLHEEKHSSIISDPHSFRIVKEWPLRSLLSKTYPDR